MIFIKLGIKNLFRNKRRSFLASTAIGVGLSALIIADGFMEGMHENMIKNATSSIIGQAQIHHEKFIDSKEAEYLIEGLEDLESKLNSTKEIKAWSKRTSVQAMLASSRDSRNILLYGVLPNAEKNITQVHNFIIEGNFLNNGEGIVLGKLLMKELQVSLGQKIVVTVSNIKTGELAQELVKIQGVLSFGSKELDKTIAFMPLKATQKLLGIQENVHEIVMKMESIKLAGNNQHPIWEKLSTQHNIARGWKKILPEVDAVSKMTNVSTMIISGILMVLISFGIINTLFMSILERVFEFGVLRAVGTDSVGIFKMILWESFSLGVLSTIIGLLVALIGGGLMAIYGIDYGGIEFSGVTFREPIYYLFKWYHYSVYPLLTIIFTVIVGIYPSIYTAKLTLADALKKSL